MWKNFFNLDTIWISYHPSHIRFRLVEKVILNMDLDLGVLMMCNELQDTDKLVHAWMIPYFACYALVFNLKLRFGFEVFSHKTFTLIRSYVLEILIRGAMLKVHISSVVAYVNLCFMLLAIVY